MKSSADDLSEILVFPKLPQQKKKRAAVNATAKCVTNDDVLSELRKREQEKVEEKDKCKIRRRQKKRETSKRIHAGCEPRGRKKETVVQKLENLSLSSESEAECPECGLVYGDDDSTWINCDGCGVWRDLKCAGILSVGSIPDEFYCHNCT